jgi:hypothetical protein
MFCLLLALSLLMTSGVALAAREQGRLGEPGQNREQLAAHRQQVLARVEQIKANTLEIQRLKLEFGKNLRETRQRILELVKRGNDLSEEQVARLREMNRLIRRGRLQLGSTVGQIREQSLQMRINRLNREYEAALDGLDRVLQIQEQRIAELEALLRELSDLVAFVDSL